MSTFEKSRRNFRQYSCNLVLLIIIHNLEFVCNNIVYILDKRNSNKQLTAASANIITDSEKLSTDPCHSQTFRNLKDFYALVCTIYRHQCHWTQCITYWVPEKIPDRPPFNLKCIVFSYNSHQQPAAMCWSARLHTFPSHTCASIFSTWTHIDLTLFELLDRLQMVIN